MTQHETTTSPVSSRDELFAALDNVTIAEARNLRRRLSKARDPRALRQIGRDIQAATDRLALINTAIPQLTYPDSLPVSRRVEDIAAAIKENQVVIIAGETGSGKTTQIPKICLDIGRGRRGLIGHTQPRRIAARTVAERIASELNQDIGSL